jgi:hypothetical protein
MADLSGADLLDGPRGRRLVLEFLQVALGRVFAAHSDGSGEPLDRIGRELKELFSTVGEASYALDPGAGSTVVRYSTREPRDWGLFGPGSGLLYSMLPAEALSPDPDDDPDPQRSAAAAGAALGRALRLLGEFAPAATAGMLDEAWGIAINNARYWQEPDGDDLLAENPRVAACLRRVAGLLVDSGALHGWEAVCDPGEQFAVDWIEDEDTAEAGTGAGTDSAAGTGSEALAKSELNPQPATAILLDWWSQTVDAEQRDRKHFKRDPGAMAGGEWWSCPPRNLTTTSGPYPLAPGPSELYLVEDSFDPETARVTACLPPVGSAMRIHEIHTPEDWVVLVRRFPLDVSASRRNVWYLATGRDVRWLIPGWQQVAEHYDAVHVSLAGYLRTAGRALPVGGMGWLPGDKRIGHGNEATVMAGWNPDETFWLHDLPQRMGRTVTWRWCDEPDPGHWVRD